MMPHVARDNFSPLDVDRPLRYSRNRSPQFRSARGSRLTGCLLLQDKAALPKSYGGYQMSNENSDAFKIRRAPNGKFYVWGNSEVICLPNGSLHYFETEREPWVFLAEWETPEIS